MIFNLNKFFKLTKYKYVFVNYLMNENNVDKPLFLRNFGIDYDVFRVEKSRDKVNNDNADKIISFFNINPVSILDKLKYEKCINNIYYAIYFKETDRIKKCIEEINIYIDDNNYLKPIFILFKVFGNMNIGDSIDNIKYLIKNDLDYLLKFKKYYFIDEFEIIYEAILISFKYKTNLTKITNLGNQYKELNWIYLFTKGSALYLDGKYNDVYRCYQSLEKEFESTRNIERLMIIHSNICFIHNALSDYQECIDLVTKSIEYIYSSRKSIWISNILMHFLFSNFMLNRYDVIIKLFSEEIFDLSRLNWITASICILASFINKQLSKAYSIIEKFRNDEYVLVVLDYIKTGNKLLLLKLKQTPYIKKIINKLD